MTTSEQINELAAALAKAQAAMKNAALNKTNPHFRSKYADLAGIRDAVIPSLTANGIAVVQTLDVLGHPACDSPPRLYVLTRLLHASGQWIESRCQIPDVPDMQKMGSAITYARRYSLSAICGIAADEDDDANEAARPNGDAKQTAAPKGYENWIDDMISVAQEGSERLKAAWTKSKPEYRQHLTATNNPLWESLKARAAAVKAAVPA